MSEKLFWASFCELRSLCPDFRAPSWGEAFQRPSGTSGNIATTRGEDTFRGGACARAFWHYPGFQNPEYASPELRKCFSGLPKSRVCFPWAVEMLLARQNTEKQGKSEVFFFFLKKKKGSRPRGGGGPRVLIFISRERIWGLLSFIRVWGSKNDRFQQLQQQQLQQQTRQVRMLQSESFLEQIKSHPSDTFF